MNVLKVLGLGVLFALLAFAQPLVKELNRELKQAQRVVPAVEDFVLGATDSVFDLDAPIATDSSPFFLVYPVVKVVDGDTIKVDMQGKTETIRIIGINTPETVDPRKAVECFGKEASEKAKELLTDTQVSLEADKSQGERDRYGRLLRYVFLEDGTDYGLKMIKDGYAYEYLYDEPYLYHDRYQAAQASAEQEKIGLWANENCAQ